jgi:hypothetical protein
MAEDYQELIHRRAAVVDEITKVIDRLGDLVCQERDLQDRLRRLGEAAGVRANAFSTQLSVLDAINSELTRVGLSPRRSDPRLRLGALVTDQHRRYRGQREMRERVVGQSAA